MENKKDEMSGSYCRLLLPIIIDALCSLTLFIFAFSFAHTFSQSVVCVSKWRSSLLLFLLLYCLTVWICNLHQKQAKNSFRWIGCLMNANDFFLLFAFYFQWVQHHHRIISATTIPLFLVKCLVCAPIFSLLLYCFD